MGPIYLDVSRLHGDGSVCCGFDTSLKAFLTALAIKKKKGPQLDFAEGLTISD